MTEEIEVKNTEIVEAGTNIGSIIEKAEPADYRVGFLAKHHINGALTFKRAGGTDMFAPVIDAEGRGVRYIRIDEGGEPVAGETLSAKEALIVGRKAPSYAVNDLASACIINKYSKRSALVYRDEENFRIIAELFPEARIIGVSSGILEKYKGRAININGYEVKDNPRLHRRDFRNLEEFHRAGGDIYSLLGIEVPRFKIEQVGRAVNSFVPRPWIIQNLLPASPSLNMLYAPSGTAKTYFVLDWGATISSGEDNWFGLKVKPSSFLYLCGEGFDSIASRIKVWFQEKNKLDGIDDIPFYVVNSTFKFNDEKDMTDFQTALEFYFSEYKPDVIAVDTMNLFMAGDENSTKDATSFVISLKDFALKNHCTILLVHHTGVMTEERARGSSAFYGAMDSVIAVWDNGHGVKILEQKKSRNKKIQSPMAFELEEHVINGLIDPDTGEEMSDCILKMLENSAEIKGQSAIKPEERFLVEVCVDKSQKGKDWTRISRQELVNYARESEIYRSSKTSATTLMNPKQKGRPLYKLLEREILKDDSDNGDECYALIGIEVIDAVKKRIEEESESASDEEEAEDDTDVEYYDDEDDP